MSIDQRIPDLSDKAPESLQANAVRLAQSGNYIQRRQAESLSPLLGAEMEAHPGAGAFAVQKQRRTTTKRAAVAANALPMRSQCAPNVLKDPGDDE